MARTRITPDMWPDLKPGEIKVTLLDETGEEALFSVGRRSRTKHVVLSRAEALVSFRALADEFGFTARDLTKKHLKSA